MSCVSPQWAEDQDQSGASGTPAPAEQQTPLHRRRLQDRQPCEKIVITTLRSQIYLKFDISISTQLEIIKCFLNTVSQSCSFFPIQRYRLSHAVCFCSSLTPHNLFVINQLFNQSISNFIVFNGSLVLQCRSTWHSEHKVCHTFITVFSELKILINEGRKEYGSSQTGETKLFIGYKCMSMWL